MRDQRAGNGARSAAHVDGDFAFGIEAGQIVVVAFRGAETIADEDEPGGDFRRRIDAGADDGFRTDGDIPGFAIADKGKARMRFIKLQGFEFDWLDVALLAGGFEAIAFKVGGHVVGGFSVLRTAGLAALHLV